MYFLIFPCSSTGLKQVGLSSFYHFYEIRSSPPYFRSEIMSLSSSFLTVLKVYLLISMRVRAGKKLVYPHFITFPEFEFHPLFFGLRL